MKKKTKKMLMIASVMGVAVLLAGCSSCPSKHAPKHQKVVRYAQPVEMVESDTIVVYQTYENADINKVYAKMYTHSSHGGESKMGHIKFHETDNGLKMTVDLKDLRPGVPYNVRLYQCGSCNNDVNCCSKSAMNVALPMLETGESRRLNQTYLIQGLSAAQINGANIYLERDGGYKAGWGKLEK
jgi:Cu/Zn superoxide dismutase